MIDAGAMKQSNGSPRHRRKRTQASQRARLLQAFDRSGLSAAAFARRHDLHYTTFCNWRRRRPAPSPGFVQVELPVPTELVIELGAHARLRLTSNSQIELAARLLQRLQTSC